MVLRPESESLILMLDNIDIFILCYYMLLYLIIDIHIKGNVMRTSLNIDDAMLNEVMKITGVENRSEAIRIALASYLKQQRKNKILALRGNVDIEDNWQQLRELEKSE